MKKALYIQTPKNGQRLKPSHEFLCLGFADGIDPKVLQTVGHLSAHVTAHHHGHHRLHVCGLRIPAGALPPPPEGQRPYDWGFRFPVLPRVFHRTTSLLFVRLIPDRGKPIDAKPHQVDWRLFFAVTIHLDHPSPCPASVPRTFQAWGIDNPTSASVAAWVSNTREMYPIWGGPASPPAGENWQRNFSIAAGWGNTPGSATTLYYQATDSGGASDIGSCGLTFTALHRRAR